MTKFYKFSRHWLATMERSLWQRRRFWVTAVGVASAIGILRLTGVFQLYELKALDYLFHLRPAETIDERIVIVSIDDADINFGKDWPLSDEQLAAVITQINRYQPRAIGLDLYRDLPVKSGQEKLAQVFEATPNLVAIELIPVKENIGVKPPSFVQDQQNQVGFNNVPVDVDNVVRRMLLYAQQGEKLHRSFALQLALKYLNPHGIETHRLPDKQIRLGDVALYQFQPNDGGYVQADSGGYQILANPRGRDPRSAFRKVSLRQLMQGKVTPEQFRDRIVLIGSTAVSLKDFLATPYSTKLGGNIVPVAGVEVQANFISQLLSAVLEQRGLIRTWSEPVEWLWILGWSGVGVFMTRRSRTAKRAIVAVILGSASLVGICYVAFLFSWWIPLVPALIGLAGSASAIFIHLAFQQEELRKSKEFLSSVINAIPDPVFVKDLTHRWVVLNQAYCRFIGYPLEVLLEKSDYDLFPPKQATQFRQQDEFVFQYGIEQENEEEFTDFQGVTYRIATKRSLHTDAAGNVFLVGVIRDITLRKQIEEQLKRQAEELFHSNTQLKEAKDALTRMAYYDALTGLPNRKLFQEQLQQTIEEAQRFSQTIALMFIDLDGFKQVNDTYGHQVGDLLLKAVAQRLTRCLRSSDIVARLGGDEFLILLPGIPSTEQVCRVADKILISLSQSFALEGKLMSVSSSIGISLFPEDSEEIENLIKKADVAMYHAKQTGKDRYVFYSQL